MTVFIWDLGSQLQQSLGFNQLQQSYKIQILIFQTIVWSPAGMRKVANVVIMDLYNTSAEHQIIVCKSPI